MPLVRRLVPVPPSVPEVSLPAVCAGHTMSTSRTPGGEDPLFFADLTPPYATIVADPPWHYDARPVGGATAGSMGSAQPFPYSTMPIEDIRALPVGDLAAPDAVLWLWTTNKWLRDAFSVVDAWGFQYRQTLKPAMQWVWPSSVIVTARPKARTHSVKPDCFRDYIEDSSPGPYVELFARAPRLGWDAWGKGYEVTECAPVMAEVVSSYLGAKAATIGGGEG